MDKLQNMQQQMNEIKTRLDQVTVKGEAANGKVIVIATGNRKIKDIQLDPSLMQQDPEELADYVLIATNKAIDNAEAVYETEMQGAAGGMMPGLKGMLGK